MAAAAHQAMLKGMPLGAESALYQPFLPDPHTRAFVWKYAQETGGRRPRHFHAEPELNLVMRGSAVFGVGQRRVRISRGELLAFPSGQDHELLEASPDLHLYAIGLEPAFSSAVLAGSDPSEPLHTRLEARELERVLDRAASLVERADAAQLAAELWQRSHWLARRAALPVGQRAHVLTRRVLRMLDAEPELSLDALAQELRTHPSEISRHFHRDVGTTLVRFRTRLRLLELIRLIDGGQRELMSAATAAGFGSYSQCHRAFCAELGCPPKKFFSEERARMQRLYAD